MGMISSDTLGVMLSMEGPDIRMAKKETLWNENSHATRIAEWALQNSVVSSLESVRISQLAHACRGPTRWAVPFSEAGIASVPALCGWVTGLSLGGCQEEHPGPAFSDLLHLSALSSGVHLFTVLVCVAAFAPLVRFPKDHRDVDNKSPGSDG